MELKKEVAVRMDRAFSRLAAANLLYSNNFYEEAIGIAYYAAFHAAKAVICSEDDVVEHKTHKGISGHIHRNYVQKEKMAYGTWKAFIILKNRRMEAEYKEPEEISMEQLAKSILSTSTAVVGDFKDYLIALGYKFQ